MAWKKELVFARFPYLKNTADTARLQLLPLCVFMYIVYTYLFCILYFVNTIYVKAKQKISRTKSGKIQTIDELSRVLSDNANRNEKRQK